MKKILALALALIMVLSLAACKTGGDKTNPSPTNNGTSTTLSKTYNPEYVGFFDPGFDYSSGERFKVQYMTLNTGILYEQFDDAFEHWAKRMNIDYGNIWCANGDIDLFMTTIRTFAEQGVDGFLVDPDSNTYPRVAEIMDELGLPWMGCMSPPRNVEDPAKPLLHPFVGFDHYQFGVHMADKLLEYKNELWPDADMKDVGFISVDFGVVAPIHLRTLGAQDTWTEKTGLADNFMVADCASGKMDMDTSYNLCSSLISTNSKYKYWLVAAAIDDMAMGAASALDNLGLTDNAAVVTIGGSGLQKQWDAGQVDAWRSAEFTAQNIYAEPILSALYAYMAGLATPENIWPEWINVNDHGGEGHTYSGLLLPSYWIEHDNYKSYLKWSDIYAGASYYPDYSADGITVDSYAARMQVPEYYKTAAAG